MKYSIIFVVILSIIGCNRMSDKQIGKGSKDACPSDGLSALTHSNHCPKRTESLEKAFKQWGTLSKEIEELYYIVQTKPNWYRGNGGLKTFYKDCETIKALHLSLYQISSDAPCSQANSNTYIYLEDAKELFLACCQRTIDRELPESYESPCIEHEKEMARYRKDANDHLNCIKGLLDDWIEAREQYANDLSDLTYDQDCVNRSQTKQKTSEFLIVLSEIISLP